MSIKRLLADWPGKSPATHGEPEHPALYHMLDVAAVAEILLAAEAWPADRLAALTVLVALHDLGKINADFRAMIRREPRSGNRRHWEASEVLLKQHREMLADAFGLTDPFLLDPLLSATAGHHGRPPDSSARDEKIILRDCGAAALRDVSDAIRAILALWPEARLSELAEAEAFRLSWWLPGLVAAADWIGSNVSWFPATEPGPDLFAYLAQSRTRAKTAVAEAGLSGAMANAAPFRPFASLRPMQAACAEVALAEGPMLAVIEDETGAGKTEAALILAQRMLAAGKGRGLYVALPTMATADAMFNRTSDALASLFQGAPTLTLAHGRAGLSHRMRELVVARQHMPEDPGCTEWLAEGRRRALLADIGVGTIDQALLAALPVKWQTLRHYGLASKILIVDEVHELGEPYIDATLTQLLKMHRAAGGSAILLTATLPLSQRQRLLAIYGHGPDGDQAYPALTVASGERRRYLPQDAGKRGPVAVKRVARDVEAVDLLASSVEQGAACVWVRNAVDDAIAAVRLLRAAGIGADLLHARFALGDRKRIEAAQLARFGKTGNDRTGRVLVGTQILESSLDLDFDVMISDLAPMACLIQRAGRLWRHMDLRPASSRPVSGAVLHVLSPDPSQVKTASWLQTVLGAGAYVYPVHLQWRTAEVLFRRGLIEAPAGLRALIEAVHGDSPVPIPSALARSETESMGKDAAHAGLGWQNVVKLDQGFRAGGSAHDDAEYPTRLGQPTRTLMLVRETQDGLRPLFDGPEGEMLSEVSATAARLAKLDLPDQSRSEIALFTQGWPDWKRKAVTVCPLRLDGTICEGLSYDSDLGLMFHPVTESGLYPN